MKRFIALLLVCTYVCAGLAACNTVAGAGEDMSAGGHAVTNKAEESK